MPLAHCHHCKADTLQLQQWRAGERIWICQVCNVSQPGRLKRATRKARKAKRDLTGRNPVRELPISAAERARIQRDVSAMFSGAGRDIRKAAALYSDFTGHEDVRVGKVRVASMPKTMLAIGKVDGILYSTVRDNVAEKYIHKFKASSRPLLCSSPDGKQLYLLGGAYDFTERGIVDKTP
jgi:hypothetical protein